MHLRGIKVQKHICLEKQAGLCLRNKNSRIDPFMNPLFGWSPIIVFQPRPRCFVHFTSLAKIATERDGKPPKFEQGMKLVLDLAEICQTSSGSFRLL